MKLLLTSIDSEIRPHVQSLLQTAEGWFWRSETHQRDFSGVAFAMVLAADSGGKSIGDALGIAMTVLMAIGFIWGTIKVIQGATQLNRGAEEGGMNIVGGVLIAAAPFIMNFVFTQLDLTGSASMPGSLSAE